MHTFYAQQGLFWLDNTPQLIQAGEFHYFRTPRDQWEHRLRLLRDAGFNTVAAYIPWLWHEPQPGRFDLDGHGHPLRDLSGFLDLAAKMGLFIIARPGPYIMAETIYEGIPAWVFSQHPQVAFIDQHGSAQNIVSYLHPDFLRFVDLWYQAVFGVLAPRQISRGGNIVMTQLDNEMGMLQWVRNIIDIHPDTLRRFAAYLETTYGAELHNRYPADDIIAFLHTQMTQPDPAIGTRVFEDYRRFYRAYLGEYAAHLWARAKAHGLETPTVINVHGFANGGKTFPIGLSQLAEVIRIKDIITATDVYPIFIGEGNFHQLRMVNEMTKALQNPEQPLFSIEFQAGGNQDFSGAQASLYDLHSRLCIACGMRAINHYLFFDGENDPLLSPMKRHNWGHPVRKDGTLRRHYGRYQQLAQVLHTYGESLIRSRPKAVTSIGFFLDQFMTEVNSPLTKPAADIITHQREVILFDQIGRGLALTHRPFDAIELASSPLDPQKTPSLWVMMEKQCDSAVQQKLADYVRKGGKLILIGRMCDETFDHIPCHILRDAIGIDQIASTPAFTPAMIRAFDDPELPVSFLESYQGPFDEVFAATPSEHPVGFTRKIGSGQVMVFGAALPTHTLEDLAILDQMAQKMGVEPLFGLDEWADVYLSESETGQFVFLNNYQDDPIQTRLSLRETPLLGGHAVHVPARRGVILPMEWQMRPGIVVHYLTAEVIEIVETADGLQIRTANAECDGELSLDGYECVDAYRIDTVHQGRLKVRTQHGLIEIRRS